jgi:hypothetical protein
MRAEYERNSPVFCRRFFQLFKNPVSQWIEYLAALFSFSVGLVSVYFFTYLTDMEDAFGQNILSLLQGPQS